MAGNKSHVAFPEATRLCNVGTAEIRPTAECLEHDPDLTWAQFRENKKHWMIPVQG
jgi:hypothetical protein